MKVSYLMIKTVSLLMIALIGSSCTDCTNVSDVTLPYYEDATFTPVWFASAAEVPEDFHTIDSFELTNQKGEVITDQALDNKVYVVNFFFASCPGICPKMTTNMTLVQDAFLEQEKVMLLSHSVTPDYDSVSVLKEYGDLNKIESDKWYLLTGDRDQIYRLGRSQYFIEEDLGESKDPDDFIHTENFVLVDANKHIRGIYNGLNKTSVNQLINDIHTLIDMKT